jgi:hypothetical protein
MTLLGTRLAALIGTALGARGRARPTPGASPYPTRVVMRHLPCVDRANRVPEDRC